LAQTDNACGACRAYGVPHRIVYVHRPANKESKLAWDKVLDEAMDSLEDEAYRRAHDGVAKHLVSWAKWCSPTRRSKTARPGKFR